MSRLYPLRLITATTLSALGTAETGAIDCRDSDPEYLLLKIVSASGNADVNVEVAISNDGTTFNSYTSQDPLVASTNTQYGSLNPEEYHSLVVPGAPWIKLRLTELGSLADTIADATLWMRE